MKAARTVLLGVLVLVMGGVQGQSMPSARAATSPETALYRANWSHGLAGWTALGDRGWSVAHGVLRYQGTGNGELLAPFRLPARGDIAVEAEIERGRRATGRANDWGYGVVASGNGHLWSGVAGGFFYGEQIDTPQSGLYWDGDTVSGDDVALHGGFDRFRLERRGRAYTVVENGVATVHFTISDAHGTRLGLFARGYQVRVRSLEVVSLPSAGGSGISLGGTGALPPLKTFNVTDGDVPAVYKRFSGHYYTNAEVARQRNVTTQSLDGLGRIIAYESAYRRPGPALYDDIYAEITVYRSPQAAHIDTQYLEGAYHQSSVQPEYMQSTPGMFGEEDDLSSYVYTAYDGSQYDDYYLLFRRGRYRESLEEVIPHGMRTREQALQLLMQLGHLVDGRLKHAS